MEIIQSVLKSLSFDPFLFWVQFIMFFVLHYTLKYLLYGPLMRVRAERDSKVSGKLKEAENVAAAARILGVVRDTVYYRLERFGLTVADFRPGRGRA